MYLGTCEKLKNYTFEKEIGRGASARIYSIIDNKTKQRICCKMISKSALEVTIDLNNIEIEVSILRNANHPCIPKLFDFFDDDNYFYLLEELCEGETLLNYINDRYSVGKTINENIAQQITRKLLETLSYLHERNISHRDLKLENIIVNDQNLKNVEVKLIDFGLSDISKDKNSLCQTICGSLHYTAPEILNSKPYSGTKADMWSCGVILYCLLTGFLPFFHNDYTTLFNMITKADYVMPIGINHLASCLIRALLDPNPETRISAKEALTSDFVNFKENPAIKSLPLLPMMKTNSNNDTAEQSKATAPSRRILSRVPHERKMFNGDKCIIAQKFKYKKPKQFAVPLRQVTFQVEVVE